MSTKLPARVKQDEVPVSRRWELRSVYELENDRISRWIASEAEEASSQRDLSLGLVQELSKGIARELRGIFANQGQVVMRAETARAEKGEFRRSAGFRGLRRVYFSVEVILIFLEFAIFLLQIRSGSSLAAALIQAGLLSLSGVALGIGFGRRFSDGYDPQSSDRYLFKASLFVGALGILVVSLTRVVYTWDGTIIGLREVLVVVGITTIIALLIALFGSLGIISGRKYRANWDRQYACQVEEATRLHSNRFQEGDWEAQYRNELRKIDSDYQRALERAEEKARRSDIHSVSDTESSTDATEEER